MNQFILFSGSPKSMEEIKRQGKPVSASGVGPMAARAGPGRLADA